VKGLLGTTSIISEAMNPVTLIVGVCFRLTIVRVRRVLKQLLSRSFVYRVKNRRTCGAEAVGSRHQGILSRTQERSHFTNPSNDFADGCTTSESQAAPKIDLMIASMVPSLLLRALAALKVRCTAATGSACAVSIR
jgi:hypothetical protein